MLSWSELLYDKKEDKKKSRKVRSQWSGTSWNNCNCCEKFCVEPSERDVLTRCHLVRAEPNRTEHFLCPLLIFTMCDNFCIHVILYKRRRYILYHIRLWNIFWRTSTRSEPVPRSREMLLCRVWISWLVDWSSGRWFCRARWRRWHESEDRFIRSSHRRCPRCWCRPPAGPLLHSRAPQIDFCCRVFKRHVDGFIQYLSKKAKQTRD